MKGDFNLRFGQPSKDICYVLPGLFPCSDSLQIDPLTGTGGSLLDSTRQKSPTKIIFTNTSAEYWRGDAALIHTNLENKTELPEDSEYVRRYHFSGTQHGVGFFPWKKFVNLMDGVGNNSSVVWTTAHCFAPFCRT